jgi:hypothetical protein
MPMSVATGYRLSDRERSQTCYDSPPPHTAAAPYLNRSIFARSSGQGSSAGTLTPWLCLTLSAPSTRALSSGCRPLCVGRTQHRHSPSALSTNLCDVLSSRNTGNCVLVLNAVQTAPSSSTSWSPSCVLATSAPGSTSTPRTFVDRALAATTVD